MRVRTYRLHTYNSHPEPDHPGRERIHWPNSLVGCRIDGSSWLKGTCVPTGMEDVCLRHTRTVLHKQAPACVACPCMERQFLGMNKIVMADSDVAPTLQQRHGTALLVPMGPCG